ncbi:MAG: molybdopterin biosynthesis protein [Anaerolineae bacterium]|nr:molybdopterin biosynthesis protein [Anaerolineae bacterium]
MTEHERNFYLEDMPLDEARKRLEMALRKAEKWDRLPGESVSLVEAVGRITAEPVWAKISSPHYHAVGMDGYAVQAKNTVHATETRPLRLRLDEEAFPVDTGDLLPPGTNAVIMIEDIQQREAGFIEIRASVAPWQHVRVMGEDMVATELVLPINHCIRPVDLGALAGCGCQTVNVRRRPIVTLMPTGNELVDHRQTPQPGQIIEYNSLVLSAQIATTGGESRITSIIPDDREKIHLVLDEAIRQQPDLILVLSGSSAGSQDYTASIISDMGELLVHGVAVRPGHPVIIGMIDHIPVIGVPGYPVSAALTGELFVQPLLSQWLGIQSIHETLPRVQATMTRKLLSPMGDDDFIRVTMAQIGERLLATPLSRGAGVISSLVRADGLAHIPRFNEGVDIGGTVEVILYRPMELIRQTVLMMGSHDPMIDLLGQFLAVDFPGYRLASNHVGSMGGLFALRRGDAHIAGIHLLDPETGDFNIPYIHKHLPDVPVQLITFAHREQGFLVAPDNPLNIQSFDDLPRIRYVNRQRGSGTRVLLDYELQKRDIDPTSIVGYEHEEYTHLAVAAAVASGIAECGLGMRNSAIAMKLDFVPVSWERYDLAIPDAHLHHPGIVRLLEIVKSSSFQQALAEQPGYNTRETGYRQL